MTPKQLIQIPLIDDHPGSTLEDMFNLFNREGQFCLDEGQFVDDEFLESLAQKIINIVTGDIK